MLAIITKYMPATTKLGARIIARAGKTKVTIPFPYVSSDMQVCHAIAAKELCKKLNWTVSLVAGEMPIEQAGFAFVPLPQELEPK